MNTLKLISTIAAAVIACNGANAQNMLGRLADRAKDAAENAVGKKIENAIYKSIDNATLKKDKKDNRKETDNSNPAQETAPAVQAVQTVQSVQPVQAAPKKVVEEAVYDSTPVPGSFSVRYITREVEEGSVDYYVYTGYKEKGRLDHIEEGMMLNEEDVLERYSDHTVQLNPGVGNTPVKFEEDEWSESYLAAQEVSAAWTAEVKDRSGWYVENCGFSEAGTAVVCGKTCKKYVGTISSVGGYDAFMFIGKSAEIYVWNGYTMRLVQDGKVLYEVTGFAENVPASAFEKTLNITWF